MYMYICTVYLYIVHNLVLVHSTKYYVHMYLYQYLTAIFRVELVQVPMYYVHMYTVQYICICTYTPQ